MNIIMIFLIALIFIVLPLLFSIFLSRGNSRNLKIPPSPPKLPVIGNLHQLILDESPHPHQKFRKLAQKYGPIFSLKLGRVDVIIVSSSTILREIHLQHDLNFSNRPLLPLLHEVTYNHKDIGSSPYGPYWRQIRKICTYELLSNKRVKSFRTIREEEVNLLVEEIYNETSQAAGAVINLSDKIYKLTDQVLCRAAFGKGRGNGSLLKVIRSFSYLANGFNFADFFPSLEFVNVWAGVRPQVIKLHKEIDEFLNEVLEEHRAKVDDDNANEDLVDVLLRIQKESELTEEEYTDSTIKATVLDMFLGGTDTIATTIIWAMSELMKNPGVMKEAQAEIRSYTMMNRKEKIEESDINNLTYLKLVIKETFRLHPATALLLPRETIDSCTVNGYHIPAKWRIVINGWAISRDPTNWVNAEEFQPERFKDNDVDFKGQHMEFTPFGWGRRGCPGISFSAIIVEIVVAQLLACFDWKMPNGMRPEDLNMEEVFGVLSTRKHDLCLVALPSFKLQCLAN